MKKTNLTRSLLAACSIVALSAVMYGCSSSGEDTQRDRAEGAEMTVEDLQAALAAAQAAQEAAEADRDAANAAAAAAAAAQATAEMERDAADAARMTAEQAQADAEAAQATAEAAQATAEAAQAAAEMAQATAEAAQAAAETAQATAENERDLANNARMAAEQARDDAQAARMTAEQAAREAAAGEAAAVARAEAADAAAMAAEQAQKDAEAAAMTAEERARQAEADEAAAMAAQTAAEQAQKDAEQAQKDAEQAQMDAEQAQMDAEQRATDAEQRATDAEQRATDAEAAQKTAEDNLKAANDRIAALIAGTDDALIKPAQDDAAAASTEAGEAATLADDAAEAAEDAIVGRAMFQTGEANSDDHAAMARMYAGGPDDDAEDDVVSAAEAKAAAEAASTVAQGATNAKDARDAAGDAEDAQEAAETARIMAVEQQGMAEMDAMDEVFVNDTVKSVGDKMVDFGSGDKRTVTVDDQMIITRKQRDVTQMSPAVDGAAAVAEDLTATPPVQAEAAKPGIAARDIVLGQEFDSEEDDARVTLIKSHIATRNVNAYSDTADAQFITDNTYNHDGAATYDHDNDGNTPEIDTPDVRIRSLRGRYVESTGGVTDSGTIGADADAAGITLYYYVDTMETATDTDDTTTYLRRVQTHTDNEGNVTYTYQPVNIRQEISGFPYAKDYDHFHFGVWSNLEEAEADGFNEIEDLGIGFLVVLDDGEMTELDDMPTRGDAFYDGNWVANVQAADPNGHGPIDTQEGEVEIDANFGDDDIEITLEGLAVLDGDIEGNTFSGDSATAHDIDTTTAGVQNNSGLDPDGDFEGSFEGAFFGDDAENAGGVFSFGSEDDNEDGGFVGAFGTYQRDEGATD